MAIPPEQIHIGECTKSTAFATEHDVQIIDAGLSSTILQELKKDTRPLKAKQINGSSLILFSVVIFNRQLHVGADGAHGRLESL